LLQGAVMNNEVLNRELDKIIAISRNYNAKKILLFGSCLNDIEAAKDIDIAVSGITPRDFFKYYGAVSMAVSKDVDIIDLDDIKAHLRKRILNSGKLLYESKL